MKKIIALIFIFVIVNTQAAEYKATEIATGFAIPWAIEFIDNQHAVVNEKEGHIALLDIESGKHKRIFKVPNVYSSGQAGLLDVAIAPNTDIKSPLLFFTYAKKTDQGNTLALASATLSKGELTDWKDRFVSNAISKKSRHFGSRIAFVNDKIFFSIGDRGIRDNGQNTQTHAGAILRLNVDGSIPSDNPFTSSQAKPEIWSYGHRNPQGLFYDETDQRLWSIEHGPRGGDEINLIKKGRNYGWARVSHGKEYWGPFNVGEARSLPNMEDPKLVYTPSIAPSSMVLYRGNKYPDLKGKILAGALKLTHINAVSIDKDKLTESQRLFADLNERIRDITISPDEYIYFSTDSGKIYRIELTQ